MIRLSTVRRSICSGLSVTALLLAVFCGSLHAQQTPAAPSPVAANDANGNPSSASGPNFSSATGSTLSSAAGSTTADANSRESLTAGQVDRVIQQNPDVVTDLKSLVADQLRQQGTDMQADDLTDEMFYGQIASSADIRASITLWLRARGYISEDDIRRPGNDVDAQGNDDDSNSLSPATLDGLPRTSVSGLSRNGLSSTAAASEIAGRAPITRSKVNRVARE